MSKKLVAHALKDPSLGSGLYNDRGHRKILESKVTSAQKRIIQKYYRFYRFWAVSCPVLAVADLSLDRTSGSRQSQVIGINFDTSLN